MPLGDLDVGAEGPLLRLLALLTGAEVVETRLADTLDLRQRGQPVDLGERLVQRRVPARLTGTLARPAVGVAEHDPRGLVGVQRDGRVDRVVGRRRLRRPPGPLEVAADLHHGRHPHRRGLGEGLLDRAGLHVEVRVGVRDRHPQGFRERRCGVLAGVVGRHASDPTEAARDPSGSRGLDRSRGGHPAPPVGGVAGRGDPARAQDTYEVPVAAVAGGPVERGGHDPAVRDVQHERAAVGVDVVLYLVRLLPAVPAAHAGEGVRLGDHGGGARAQVALSGDLGHAGSRRSADGTDPRPPPPTSGLPTCREHTGADAVLAPIWPWNATMPRALYPRPGSCGGDAPRQRPGAPPVGVLGRDHRVEDLALRQAGLRRDRRDGLLAPLARLLAHPHPAHQLGVVDLPGPFSGRPRRPR